MAVRRTYSTGSGNEIIKWWRGRIEATQDSTEVALYDAAVDGEQLMKHYISTRGTVASGKEGRIDTGRMINAVSSFVARRGDNRTQMGFGWTREKKKYFLLQEGGFVNPMTGNDVEGMYALTDAADVIFGDLDVAIGKAVRTA